MNLLTNVLLFAVLCFIVCFISSALRRDAMADIVKHSTKLWATVSLTVLGASLAIHFLMEYILAT